MPSGVFDQAARYTARIDPPGFLGWAFGLPPAGFEFRGWLDTRAVPFPGDPDRANDTVAGVGDPAAGGVPWAVAVEFQNRPDPDMFGRLVVYLGGLWLALRPDAERGSRFHLGAVVVNLTGVGLSGRDMRWSAAGLVTHLGVVERNLEREPAADLLGGIDAGRVSRGLLPWVPLMAGADDPGLLDHWAELAAAEPDRRRRADYGGLARVFAEKSGAKELWHAKLEGWEVEESAVVNEWIARGTARGAVEEARNLILRLGTRRFGAAGPAAEAAVRGVQDRDRLERMADRVLDAAGWDDILATP